MRPQYASQIAVEISRLHSKPLNERNGLFTSTIPTGQHHEVEVAAAPLGLAARTIRTCGASASKKHNIDLPCLMICHKGLY